MCLLLTLLLVISIDQISSATINDYPLKRVTLNEYPLKMDPGHWIINATMIDEGNQKFTMKEYISSSENTTRGKIEMETNGVHWSVYYSTVSPNLRNYTYKDLNSFICLPIKYSNGNWDRMMTGCAHQFINDLLIVGPSLVYRIRNLTSYMAQGFDTTIGGLAYHRYKTRLIHGVVTFYINKVDDKGIPGQIDITKSTSIVFESSRFSYHGQHRVRMDIHSIEETDQQLDTIISKSEKICANYYLSFNLPRKKSIPVIKSTRIHFKTQEINTSQRNSKTIRQVYADEKFQMVNLQKTIAFQFLPSLIERIYDYTLGVVYEYEFRNAYQQVKCTLLPMDSTAPGLTVDSEGKLKFSIKQALGFNSDYTYVGRVNLEFLRSNNKWTETWQADNYPTTTINGNQYDSILQTHYFVPMFNVDGAQEVILRATRYSALNKTSRIQTNYTIYYEQEFFSLDGDMSEKVENKFRIRNNCFNFEAQKTLALHFSCKDINCHHFMGNYDRQFAERLKEAIYDLGSISMSRLSQVKMLFKPNDTICYVTFLESPDIRDAFARRKVNITRDFHKKTREKTLSDVNSFDECLIAHANFAEPFEAIAYCDGEEKFCARYHKLEDINEDEKDGTLCDVALIPLRNIHRYSKEIALKDVEMELERHGLSFRVSDGPISSEYNLVRVNGDITANASQSDFNRSSILSILSGLLTLFVVNFCHILSN